MILTTQELLEKQLASITEKKAAKSKPVEISKQAGIRYNAELQRMINELRADIEKSVIPSVKALEVEYTSDSNMRSDIEFNIVVYDSWVDTIQSTLALLKSKWSGDKFDQWAQRLASSFIMSTDQFNKKQLNKQFASFGINAYADDTAVNEYLKASIADNTRLIKSIPEQYLAQVDSIVIGNMRSGLRPSTIESQLSDQFGVTKRRAKMIARDQSSKASNGLARKRMQSSGFEYFQWVTSKDERVRSRHSKIANKVTKYGKGIYRWDDLPLSDKGEPIAPGDDYQCRCIARPVTKAEVLKNQKEGKAA